MEHTMNTPFPRVLRLSQKSIGTSFDASEGAHNFKKMEIQDIQSLESFQSLDYGRQQDMLNTLRFLELGQAPDCSGLNALDCVKRIKLHYNIGFLEAKLVAEHLRLPPQYIE